MDRPTSRHGGMSSMNWVGLLDIQYPWMGRCPPPSTLVRPARAAKPQHAAVVHHHAHAVIFSHRSMPAGQHEAARAATADCAALNMAAHLACLPDLSCAAQPPVSNPITARSHRHACASALHPAPAPVPGHDIPTRHPHSAMIEMLPAS
jgi:hypothetical protein